MSKFSSPKPSIETESPDGTKVRLCAQCKEWKPLTYFSALPVDHRCDSCLPPASQDAAEAYDRRVALAQKKMALIIDASQKAGGLEPLERALKAVYDAWGGYNSWAQDVVEWTKALADRGKFGQAVNAALNVAKLHTKVDKMKQEDDWRAMDDENVKAALQMKLAGLLAEMMTDDEKENAMRALMNYGEDI